MSFEQALHDRCAAWRPLLDLVPLDRISSGHQGGSPPLPYIEMTRLGDDRHSHTSSGRRLSVFTIRFTTYAPSYAAAKRIAAELLARFHRADFDFSAGQVLAMQARSHAERKSGDGVWELTLDFQVHTASSTP